MDRQAIMSREAPPTNLSAEQIEKADEAIREALGLAYDCIRVWNAWSYGTMGPDDFWPVAESDERVAEIRDAVLAAIGISIKADEAPDCAGAGHAKQQEAEESAAPTYSYSSDGEGFIGPYASPEEAAADHLNDNPDDEAVDVGQNERRTAHNYVDQYHIESLLEMVAESAYEECGDCAESWLSDLTKDTEQIKELKQVVGDWIQRKEPPGFWHVDFIRRITRAELVASGHLDQPAEAGG